MDKVKVYLSGGFYSSWQEEVIKAVGEKDFYFLNPLEKEIDPNTLKWKNIKLTEEEKEENARKMRQSPWWQQDRLAIEKADIVFTYIEDYRPKILGVGAIFELGIAYALGKVVILVNTIEHRYYYEFERIFISFKTLNEGIKELKRMSWLRG